MLGPWRVWGLASPHALMLGTGSVLARRLSYIKLPETGGLPEAFTSPILQAGGSKLLCSRPMSGAYLCLAGRWPYSCCVLPWWSAGRILASVSVTRALNPLRRGVHPHNPITPKLPAS